MKLRQQVAEVRQVCGLVECIQHFHSLCRQRAVGRRGGGQTENRQSFGAGIASVKTPVFLLLAEEGFFQAAGKFSSLRGTDGAEQFPAIQDNSQKANGRQSEKQAEPMVVVDDECGKAEVKNKSPKNIERGLRRNGKKYPSAVGRRETLD